MTSREIFKMKAESNYRHLNAKLEELESEALTDIVRAESKISDLKKEITASKAKRQNLKDKFKALMQAREGTFNERKKDFIKAIESLEDQSAFWRKTEEWFTNIRHIASDLKETIKEKVGGVVK